MNDSILYTIKKMLGLELSYTPFDEELIVHINTAIMTLKQIGLIKESFFITGPNEEWSSALEGSTDFEGAKTYVYLKTKILFDPPSSSAVLDAMKSTATELEWRLHVFGDDK